MSLRFCPALAPAALLLAGLTGLVAAQSPSACPAEARVIQATYAVADLVIPIDNSPRCVVIGNKAQPDDAPPPAAKPAETQEAKLIQMITETVKPQSWSVHGGPGTIEYFPLTMSLVISQTPDVQEQVADMLAALRRLQDQEVAFEVRFVSMAEDFFERIGVDFDAGPKGERCHVEGPPSPASVVKDGPVILNDDQLKKLMEAAQGDVRTNVMQAPKITVLNGQKSTMRVMDEQMFVTGLDVRVKDGQAVYVPKTEAVGSGVEVSLQPTIAADRRSVRVSLQAVLKSVDAVVPQVPVSVPVQPKGGDGQAKPKMFTQYIQQPKCQTLNVDTTATVPDGGTVLIGGLKRVTEGRCEYGPPELSKIPYVNRLFKNVGYQRSAENVFILVTPRVIVQREEEERATGCATPEAKKAMVVEIMKRFTAAYREGKYAEAESWAQRAHELDPDNPICETALHMARVQQGKCSFTTTAVSVEECDAHPCPVKKVSEKKVANLVSKYHEACAAGNYDEAKKLARRALTIDPTCFSSKPRP
jgi:type II secretory pathway component GspD/PulD (secretin)